MTKAQAVKRLVKRWHAQVERWPMASYDVPLALYLQRNVPVLIAQRENERHAAREALRVHAGINIAKWR